MQTRRPAIALHTRSHNQPSLGSPRGSAQHSDCGPVAPSPGQRAPLHPLTLAFSIRKCVLEILWGEVGGGRLGLWAPPRL